ncbi:uncharacterized protein LOC122504786 [Leptopilina heterotoma]|uniref:uncharacterized protein LOC122504786 n=1 Tax=Leptopilina heterotoma TaxID=63436 RepID=UPI001CA8ADD4|nr:uncharacterized protein LOC122504786 [Leptopilina heterotoma]
MYRSNLKFMNLAGIVKSEDIKRYGMDAVLAPIVQNIQSLANGVELENGEIIRGNLFVVCGDNLGQHKLCGFKEGFTAAHPCMVCEPRVYKNYLRQVNEIENAVGEERIRLSKLYGINRDTILNQVEHFSPVVNIPPNTMHNFLEGAIQKNIQCYLKKICFADGRITPEDLNGRIQDFDYGYTELLFKPSLIKKQHLIKNFHQSASQTLLLAVILPLILRDIVDDDYECSSNYSKLLEITSIVMGHSISAGMTDYLAICVAEYLTDFKMLYAPNVNENVKKEAMDIDNGIDNGHVIKNLDVESDSEHEDEHLESKKLTPKQHSMVHCPRHFKIFGSLVQFWCMRVEAKYSVFKNKAKCVHNAKNLALTLAN